MNYYSEYDNCSFPYNAQPPTFDMFYEPIPEVFMLPANLAFQMQPPPYFQPYCEQPPWLVQQELSHWDQYAEPEQENYQSLQPWQDQLSDKLQQGNSASELQGMTNQVAGLVSVVHKLTRRAAEEESTPATIEFQGFESQITSATASSTSQFYQDADQPWQPQFHEPEQHDAYSPDSMAYMWKVAAQLAKESNEAQAGIYDLKQFSEAPQQLDMQNDDLDSNYSEEFICVHNSGYTLSLASDLKFDSHSVNTDSVELRGIVHSGFDVTTEVNVVELDSDFKVEPAEHVDDAPINTSLDFYAHTNLVVDDLAAELKEVVDLGSKSAVLH
ncbi:hypothetical protein V8G54_019963 [Vigna mungo]|uniref:Uncharacterized protein n=1 Tax=Vigna mungo TaxID=3915 RepID=A0AAQ3RU88_VIGMU